VTVWLELNKKSKVRAQFFNIFRAEVFFLNAAFLSKKRFECQQMTAFLIYV